ncbi:MAG: sensor histidine kinase [Bacteroidota bacterium]
MVKFTRLLGFKLFLIILTVMIGGTFVFATLTINWHSEQYLRHKIASLSGVSDVLNRSMHYSMLLNRRDDLKQIIQTVGHEPGILAVRIYNKKGEITFSSDSTEIGRTANLKDKECSACHGSTTFLSSPKPNELTRIFPVSENRRVLGMITPIRNEESCSEASCHAHPESQTILGILDYMVPLDELDASLIDLKRVQYINAFLLVFVVTGLTGIFIWRMVNIPVRKLTGGTTEIAKGNLNYRIRIRNNNEIGSLAESFNSMADELQRARDELTGWNQQLENRVLQKTEELRRAQSHLFQVDKMASLGTLAATVAHELNNPLEGILTYAKLLRRRLGKGDLTEEMKIEMVKELTMIADETARCGNIVKNLLLFSRQKVGEYLEVDIRNAIDQSLKLMEHHFKMHNIKLDATLPSSPVALTCDPNQIEQALLAIEINAVEAMPEGGTIRIFLSDDIQKESIRIEIGDTGIGIRDEDMPHIFEPFYTTKHDGKGTGLGLAVVYGIVERHGGFIQVKSKVHEGTTFILELPKNLRNLKISDTTSEQTIR